MTVLLDNLQALGRNIGHFYPGGSGIAKELISS